MSRPRLTAFCVFLMMFVVGSGVACAQELNDAHMKFIHGYNNEFFQSQEQKMMEYYEFSGQLMNEYNKNRHEWTKEHLTVLNLDESWENYDRIRIDLTIDDAYATQQPLADKLKELFPDDAQKMRQRQFQMNEGIMQRLESLNDIHYCPIINWTASTVYVFEYIDKWNFYFQTS